MGMVQYTVPAIVSPLGGSSPARTVYDGDHGLWVDLSAKPEDYRYPLTHEVVSGTGNILRARIRGARARKWYTPALPIRLHPTPTPTLPPTPWPHPPNYTPPVHPPAVPTSTPVPGHPRCEANWHHSRNDVRTTSEMLTGKPLVRTITFNETVLMYLPENPSAHPVSTVVSQPPVTTPVYRGSGQVVPPSQVDYYGQESDEHYEVSFDIAPGIPFDPREYGTPFPLTDPTPNPNYPIKTQPGGLLPDWYRKLIGEVCAAHSHNHAATHNHANADPIGGAKHVMQHEQVSGHCYSMR